MANYNGYSNGNQSGDIQFKVVERLGVLESHKSGWNREVNIVAWNGNTPKFDIRDWDPEHERCSRGITLYEREAIKLAKILVKRLQMDGPDQWKEVQPARRASTHQNQSATPVRTNEFAMPVMERSEHKDEPDEPDESFAVPEQGPTLLIDEGDSAPMAEGGGLF